MLLIYLYRPQDGQIATCETPETAERAEARGFVRCSPVLHRILWQKKARRAILALWPRRETAPLARVVGE